jgi:ankyrin repeat protein
MTYLHCASAAGDLEAVKLLTETLRAKINPVNVDGRTALILASCNGHPAIVEHLLRCGADPNIQDAYGLAPFHFLSRFHPNVVGKISKLLVAKGAYIDMVTGEGEHSLLTAMQTEGNFDFSGEVAALKAMLELVPIHLHLNIPLVIEVECLHS